MPRATHSCDVGWAKVQLTVLLWSIELHTLPEHTTSTIVEPRARPGCASVSLLVVSSQHSPSRHTSNRGREELESPHLIYLSDPLTHSIPPPQCQSLPPSPTSLRPPSHIPSDLHSSSTSLVSNHPHRSLFFPSHWSHLPHLSLGAGPFITKLVHQLPSGWRVHWESRKHRKRVAQRVESPTAESIQQRGTGELKSSEAADVRRVEEEKARRKIPWYAPQRLFPWHPYRIAYWTAVLFDVGSLCFVFSSICAFIPRIYDSASLNTGYVGWTAFAGSVFFTIGSVFGVWEVVKAPLIATVYPLSHERERQLHAVAQGAADKPKATSPSASSSPSPPPSFLGLLWRLDFWVTVIQLIGAISFNLNTLFFSGYFTLSQAELTGLVDFCDVFASCLFTISGYLSILEVTHSLYPVTSHPLDDLTRIDMHITWNNTLGGIGFLLNGILIIYYPDPGQLPPAYPLLIGSVFFQIGSHLQFLEQGDKWPAEGNKSGVSETKEGGGGAVNGGSGGGGVNGQEAEGWEARKGERGENGMDGRVEEGRASGFPLSTPNVNPTTVTYPETSASYR